MKRSIVGNPRLPQWRIRLFIRQLDELMDAQFERRREFNRRKLRVLSRNVGIPP